MAAEQQKATRKIGVPRFPGDIMLYPLSVGLLLHSFVPQVLEIGSFTTAVAKGAPAIVGIVLLFVGASIDLKTVPKVLKTGLTILIPKLAIAIAFGLFVAKFMNDNFFGLNALSIIGGITFCNVALYIGITAEYGTPDEQGAAAVLSLVAGPAVTMIALGAAGVAAISPAALIGTLLPLVLGVVLGNLSPFIRGLLVPGINPCIAVVGFALGCGMSVENLITGGPSGILLAVLCIITGILTMLVERLLGGSGKASLASATIAGTATTTPAAVASVDPTYTAQVVANANAQLAAAVVITALVAPAFTGWLDKKLAKKNDAGEVQASEEVSATE